MSNYQSETNNPAKPMQFKSLEEATGVIPYGMTNDYMFRAVLQKNNKVLRGLIGSLLHLSEEEMVSVIITNPIVIGEAITDKEFRLDINVELNNKKLINLEMQVADLSNWQDRSLAYLCRSFDQLNKGQDYEEVKEVIHIGFLDYTLFKNHPEFYAQYCMANLKEKYKFSDKFNLYVLNLTKIDLATEEDKQYGIDYWAHLFKATTWEELKTLSSENQNLQEATKSIFEMTADQLVQKRCLDRQEYYAYINSMKRKIAEKDEVIAEKDNALAEKDNALAEKDNALVEKDNALAEKDNALAEKDNALAEKDNALAKKDNEIAQKNNELSEKDNTISTLSDELKRARAELEALKIRQ